MEILHKELGYVETLMKKDPNISTLDGLVHLTVEVEIQKKKNWMMHVITRMQPSR